MPELPEVEVTRRGLAPHIEQQRVTAVVLRRAGLRWPFPVDLAACLTGHYVLETGRRGKYLLLHFKHGTLLYHLGMSGHLRVLPVTTIPDKHDHIDLVFGAQALRMTDPRRFGAVLWHPHDAGPLEQHVLLRNLGVEPLQPEFTAELMYRVSRQRSAAIKQVLMAGDLVVGVGNIYASESLFKAGINPRTQAGRISLARYRLLVQAIRDTLAAAIEQGGSTLKDFIGVNGQSGYFQQSYFVYAREGKPCRICAEPVRQIRQGQRASFYCVQCQK